LLTEATILANMSVLGVVVVTGASPRVHAVILEGSLDAPEVVDTFELRTASTEPSEQAVDLARHIQPKVEAASYEAIGIRVAGTPPVARRNKAVFSRAHCEGALIYVMRAATGNPVVIVDPVTAPKSIGLKKAQLEELVASLTSRGVNGDAVLAAIVARGRL
jgi:hypothetical protein